MSLPAAAYEDYLDAQLSDADRHYLDSASTQRALVELGYRGAGDTLTRADFEARQLADRERHLHKEAAPRALAGAGRDFAGRPLLAALAAREELVRNGKLATIIFLRDTSARGQEVSGYIDFAQRLRVDDWEAIFGGRVKLAPRPSDLSYYNWSSGMSTSNASPNFVVVADAAPGGADGVPGLLFRVKRDRKVICVNPAAPPGENTTRTEIATPEHLQVVLYDHFARRRA